MTAVRRKISILAAAVATVAAGLCLAAPLTPPASQPAATQPAAVAQPATQAAPEARKPANRPLLQELSNETQSLYDEVKGGIVRVQLPPPKWLSDLADSDDPLGKWGSGLNAETRETLRRQREEYDHGQNVQATAVVRPIAAAPPPATQSSSAATQPISQPVAQGDATTQPARAAAAGAEGTPAPAWRIESSPAANGGHEVVFQSGGNDGGMSIALHSGGDVQDGQIIPGGGGLKMTFQNAGGFSPNNFGLLLDDAGHIVVPLYIEKETVGPEGVRVAVGDAAPVMAKFVASDRLTNLTILQLEKPSAEMGGKPVTAGAAQPPRGSMILLMQPNSGMARLAVWNGGERDYGVAIAMDGSVLGFARYGQFLSAAACKPVADQLIAYGVVKRPKLGMSLRGVSVNDTVRQSNPALGDRPALCISDVAPGSIAERAGLRKGDFILAIDGGEQNAPEQPVGDTPAFAAMLLSHRGPTNLLILRDGHEMHISVQLETP